MTKDILTANATVKPNSKEMEILHKHFAQCFNKEGQFDIEKFQTLIKEEVVISKEGYDLNFLGKSYAKLLASIDTTTIIQPDLEHNSKPENINSKNIYISGDKLDGLKHLLKSYAGMVKCIYIDPPYNTGSDGFVYNDNFNFTVEELCTKLSISEEQAAKIIDLTKRGSASHSAWLMFMYPRLQLAKDLLTDDGVIFISIDDNEQANLKLLCDNVFGEERFISTLKWKRKKQPSFLAKHVAGVMEYILVYAKDRELLGKLSIDGTSDSTKKVINISNTESIRKFKKNVRIKIDGDGVLKAGRYKIRTMEVEYLDDVHYSNGYTLNEVDVKSRFSVSQQKIDDYIDKQLLFITAQKGLRRDVSEEEIGKRKSITDLLLSDWGDNQESDEEIKSIFGDSYFDYAKPTLLIKNLLKSNQPEKEIVLDFFSGSGTTAQAVMELNTELTDPEEFIRFILIQLPENLDNNLSEASIIDKPKIKKVIHFLDSINKNHTLDQVGIERIKRVAQKIKKESNTDLDLGFKHYTLIEPSTDTIDRMEVFNPTAIFADENILSQFGKDSVLETWMVKDGYGFGAKTEPVKLDKYTAYLYGKHLYFVDTELSETDVVVLIDKYHQDPKFNPENFVIFGYSFTFSQTEMLRKNIDILKDSCKNLKPNIDVRY